MACFRRLLLIAILALSSSAVAQLHAQGKKPVPPTPEQSALVDEGIALHDKGEYDAAIEKYKQVLDANPEEMFALYEMSWSYLAKEEPELTIEHGERGLEYDSPAHRDFSVAVGTAYDMLKRPTKAINVYKKGIEVTPDYFLLHFNLGITYLGQNNLDEGTASMKRSMSLRPDHPGSHNALAIAYSMAGERIPAMLACLRFLSLEPNTPRAERALMTLEALRTKGVSQKDGGNIDVKLSMPAEGSDMPEGDFTTANMAVSMTAAHDFIDTSKKTAMEKMVERYGSLFTMLEMKDKEKPVKHGFARDYYAPYFQELHRKGHTEAFCYFISQTSGDKDVIPWLKEHRDKVRVFLEWSESYVWATPTEK